jgi:hypothetical protein
VNIRSDFSEREEVRLAPTGGRNGSGDGRQAETAEGRAVRSDPSDAGPKVCMLTSRNFIRLAYQAAAFEAQDVLCQTADVDLIALEPGPGFAIREQVLRKLLWRDFSGRLAFLNPGFRPVRLAKTYDVLVAYCAGIRDLLHVNAIRNWTDRCRTSVCILDEIWAASARKCERYLQVLRRFDHVVVGLEGSAGIVGELIGRACHFVPAAADALRFSPYPSPPPRVVDVYSFGRRREPVHRGLADHAARHGLFYLHETLEGGVNIVRDYRQHRDQVAAIAKRSRCIVVAPAKFDRPDERGTQNEISNRYYEASAAGAVMIGEAPDCESFRRLFDWPQAVVGLDPDGSDAGKVMTELLGQPDLLRRLGCRNAEQALRKHDWVYRWMQVFQIAGLAPTPGMNGRAQRLHRLADLAAEDAA